MPHMMIDYSANLEREMDFGQFCNIIRLAMIESGLFVPSGIRVRAMRAEHVSIADGSDTHAYIDMSLRLREGRALEDRKRATAQIFAAAHEFLKPLMARRPLALSMEMRDIDAELSPKDSSIAAYLKGQEQ